MSLFDTTNASSTGIQDGTHLATVVGGEVKTSKTGGRYINLKWKVESGGVFFAMYTIENNNQQAVNIGLAELGRLQIASKGSKGPVDSIEELLGLSCNLTVANVSDDYGDKIKIKKYSPATTGEANPFL